MQLKQKKLKKKKKKPVALYKSPNSHLETNILGFRCIGS